MALFKCKMCGGDLTVAEGVTVAECEYCGTKQTVPRVMDENLQNLFNRANTLRIKCEFDKAEKLYEKIVQADSAQAEAYWGLILCKYGIEYVDDPATFQKIPTCHRASYDSIIADEDYKAALENADTAQRALYEAQAKEIDRIQKEILSLAQREESYDVFICYKETDADGRRTQDSVIANDIYYQLTQEGFKVFYAAITLEGKLGTAYEPIIFAALHSAKVMLAVGTRPEHFNAVWVKNEWSRFLKIIQTDRTKLLIPCYRDMDAYELPEEFAHLQAQDMAKIGFVNDLVRGIKRVITKDAPSPAVVKETVVVNNETAATANIAPLLERAFMFLEDGDFARADEFCEQVLNQDPKNAQAYLGKLMAELRVRKQDALKDQSEPFDGNNNYQKAVRFADEALKVQLQEYVFCNLENAYAVAVSAMNMAQNTAQQKKDYLSASEEYNTAAKKFSAIRSFRDSEKRALYCLDMSLGYKEQARVDATYDRAISAMNTAKTIPEIQKVIEDLESVDIWKDVTEKISTCKEKIALLEKAKRQKKIIITAVTAVTTIIILIFIVLLIIANNKYNNAKALMESGESAKAYQVFSELGNYKDAARYVTLYKAIENGDSFTFGAYEQDNTESNGKEEIEWIPLSIQDNKLLVISKYALDCKQYNTISKDTTWATCTLRKWLNSDFINSAFSTDEKATIYTVTVTADKDPIYNTDPGKETQDKVFLLSITEVQEYFSSDKASLCEPTDYAVENGAWNSFSDNCSWWLRSPGANRYVAAVVDDDGFVRKYGHSISNVNTAVRPAMWIDLSKIS